MPLDSVFVSEQSAKVYFLRMVLRLKNIFISACAYIYVCKSPEGDVESPGGGAASCCELLEVSSGH